MSENVLLNKLRQAIEVNNTREIYSLLASHKAVLTTETLFNLCSELQYNLFAVLSDYYKNPSAKPIYTYSPAYINYALGLKRKNYAFARISNETGVAIASFENADFNPFEIAKICNAYEIDIHNIFIKEYKDEPKSAAV